MKSLFIIVSLLAFSLVSSATSYGRCEDSWIHGTETNPGNCGINKTPGTITKNVPVTIYWLDGYQRTVTISDTGQAGVKGFFTTDCPKCWPSFHPAFWEDDGTTAYWRQRTYRATINMSTNACTVSTTPSSDNRQGHRCSFICGDSGGALTQTITGNEAPNLGEPAASLADSSCCSDVDRFACLANGGTWSDRSCYCYSPIVIDVAGNGFNLTNAANGVSFDLGATGASEQLSWTSANSDDAWLALDRNGNGMIDDGKELFGSSTAQPYLSPGESKNGFRALALLDRTEYGGNDDGQIDVNDSIFARLKLWQDRNHNGVSEAEELQSLANSTIRILELRYHESKREDENGNWFRYRAKVRDARGAQAGRWAWDVFLHKAE